MASHEPALEPLMIQLKYAPLEAISGARVYGKLQHQDARAPNLQCAYFNWIMMGSCASSCKAQGCKPPGTNKGGLPNPPATRLG